MRNHSSNLLRFGVLLFLLALITGVLIPHFSSVRLGLSAHLSGILNGMALMLFGLMWPLVNLRRGWKSAGYWLILAGLYGSWLAITLAAVWGASHALPLAGAGSGAPAWAEDAVGALLTAASAAVFGGVLVVLYGLMRKAD